MPAQFTIDVEGSTAVAKMLHAYPDKVTRATVRALNRAIASAKTLEVREIARDIGIKSAAIREHLPIREATASNLSATLAASLKRIPLIDLDARGPEPSRGQGRGVSYRLSGTKRIRDAFIATMGSGHRGVFRRAPNSTHKSVGAWSKNLPLLKELRGPSLGRVFEKYRAAAEAKANEAFQKNFDHELEFAGGAVTGAE